MLTAGVLLTWRVVASAPNRRESGVPASPSFALIANQTRLWIETKLKVATLLGLAINARRTAGPELGDDRSANHSAAPFNAAGVLSVITRLGGGAGETLGSSLIDACTTGIESVAFTIVDW